MKWWGWLAAGVAATLIFFGLIAMLQSLGVLTLHTKFADDRGLIVGGLIIIWAVCIAGPLVLKAIKAAKGDK